MDVFQLDNTKIGENKAGDSFTCSSSKSCLLPFFSASSLRQEPCRCPIATTFSSLFLLIVFSQPSLAFCSWSFFLLPTVSFALPSADSQDLSLISWLSFFLYVFPFLQLLLFSPLFQCSLPFYLSINFLLCMKKKRKSISCKPLFYFSNEKAHQWACPDCALFSTRAWNTLVKRESARFRGSTQWVACTYR